MGKIIKDAFNELDYPVDRLLGIARPGPSPTEFSLAEYRGPILNQGAESDCTSFGIFNAMHHYIRKRATLYDFDMSANFQYWNARYLDGDPTVDQGAQLRSAIKAAASWGIAHEEAWPSTLDNIFTEPNAAAYADAVECRIHSYYRIPAGGVDWLRYAISQGYCPVIGIKLYSGWNSVDQSGLVPDPEPGEVSNEGHCMCLDAYDPYHFTAVNQYGEYWGDHGVCYLSNAYLANPDNALDFWVFKVVGSDAEVQAGVA